MPLKGNSHKSYAEIQLLKYLFSLLNSYQNTKKKMYDKQGLLFPQLAHSEVVTNVGFEIKKKR